MDWFSKSPKELQSKLKRVKSKKLKVILYVMNKIFKNRGWITLDMDNIVKVTGAKPKKIRKVLMSLKKKDVIHYHSKKLEVEPTQRFLKIATKQCQTYLNRHPKVKKKLAKEQKKAIEKAEKRRHKRHHHKKFHLFSH